MTQHNINQPIPPNHVSTGTWVFWHIFCALITGGIGNIIVFIAWLSYRSRLRTYEIRLAEYNAQTQRMHVDRRNQQ